MGVPELRSRAIPIFMMIPPTREYSKGCRYSSQHASNAFTVLASAEGYSMTRRQVATTKGAEQTENCCTRSTSEKGVRKL